VIEIGIVGAKNAGKTTLVVEMTRLLTATGERVATIKHSAHGHTFDTEGKDSCLHRHAGAGLTVAISESELALFADPDDAIHDAMMVIVRAHFDWCLVEGDKRSNRPKILLTRNRSALKGTLPEHIIASYGDEFYPESVPHFDRGSLMELIEFVRQSNSA
jgi:molybdopterin-guanine dinucleotide biosynthesis protein MobB